MAICETHQSQILELRLILTEFSSLITKFHIGLTFSQKLTWEVDPTRIFTWKINLLIGPQIIKTILETSEHWMGGISFFILRVLIHQTSWHYGLNIFRSACLFIVCKRRRKCFHQDLNMGFHTTHYNPSPSPRAISIDQCMDKTFFLNLFFFFFFGYWQMCDFQYKWSFDTDILQDLRQAKPQAWYTNYCWHISNPC